MFTRLLGNFTSRQHKNRLYIDYILDTFVNGNFDCLEQLIQKEFQDRKDQKRFLRRISHVEEYLKYVSHTHIAIDYNYIHIVYHGLYKGVVLDGPKEVSFIDCKKPFQFIQDIKKAVTQSNRNLQDVLDAAMTTTQLYMDHYHRRYCQKIGIT